MHKLAEFKHIGDRGDYRTIWKQTMMHTDGTMPGYVRVSEWVEVDFPPRRDEAAIPEEVRQLDAKLEELKADFAKKVTAIEEAKANLLSLVYSPAGA